MSPKRKRKDSASSNVTLTSTVATASVKSCGSNIDPRNFMSLTTNDNCISFGIVEKGLNQLEGLPALSVKLQALTLDKDVDDLTYYIRCKNVQERPPIESYNVIHKPFLPLRKTESKAYQEIEYEFDHPDKSAYVIAEQYQFWKQRMKVRALPSNDFSKHLL